MYRPVVIFCAEGLSWDRTTSTVTAFSIIDDITPQGYPVLIPRLCIVSIITREAADSATPEASFRIDLNGTELFSAPAVVNFEDKLRHRGLLQIGGMFVPAPGILRATAVVQGQVIQHYDIALNPPSAPVVQAQAEAPASNQPPPVVAAPDPQAG